MREIGHKGRIVLQIKKYIERFFAFFNDFFLVSVYDLAIFSTKRAAPEGTTHTHIYNNARYIAMRRSRKKTEHCARNARIGIERLGIFEDIGHQSHQVDIIDFEPECSYDSVFGQHERVA